MMTFKLHSKRCIIYINKHEEPCFNCKYKKIKTLRTEKKKTDFSNIVRGRLYGANSRRIYKKFCKLLGWDISKVDQFGWQKPLFAPYADTNRTSNVWFIFNTYHNRNKLDSFVKNCHIVNFIKDKGDFIIEIDNICNKTNEANRITFIKTSNGYEFLGVYKMILNGGTRIYKRISDYYPMK